jgi:branched-chain amino acid transport system ATP-binding protein
MMLEVVGVTKTFGGLRALTDLSLFLEDGEILGLIGPNGAGKTVLVNIITGFEKPNAGMVLFKGKNICGLRPDVIVNKGIGRAFQQSNLFFDNTVRENILLGLQKYSKIGLLDILFNWRANTRKHNILNQKTNEILETEGLVDLENAKAGSIPYGVQRRLSLAMALASNPKLLLLDEPFVGLNPSEVDETLDRVRGIAHNFGMTILIIEHNMKVIKSLCDRVVVLNFGLKIAEGSPSEIQQNEEVIQAYLGS